MQCPSALVDSCVRTGASVCVGPGVAATEDWVDRPKAGTRQGKGSIHHRLDRNAASRAASQSERVTQRTRDSNLRGGRTSQAKRTAGRAVADNQVGIGDDDGTLRAVATLAAATT